MRDPQLETSAEFPEATIEMRNGATVSCRLLPHDEAEVIWAGEWAPYAAEGSDELDEIADVALKYATQADR